MRLSPLALLILCALTIPPAAGVDPPEHVLQALPTEVQKGIGETRAGCGESEPSLVTSGDEGLQLFTVSGMQGVLIDELNLCRGECIHGANCATGYSHEVNVYIRSGNSWKRVFSNQVTGPSVFLSIEPVTGSFRALVFSVHGGDKGCPIPPHLQTKGNAWKLVSCDVVMRWDDRSRKFTYRPL